ncbi:hypothetical protein NQD34_014261 [Periophthalmus magnuspinnatus]|nr:hypothetical protein NQD34_014261 [Periophthalmus magnuspinnatus]
MAFGGNEPREFILKEGGEEIVVLQVNVGTDETAAVNDFCRFCCKNLRRNGVIGHSVLIFSRSKPECKSASDRLEDLGLIVKPSRNKSTRMCKTCLHLVERLEKAMSVFRKWKEEEEKGDTDETASTNSPEPSHNKRARSPSPSAPPAPHRPLPKKPRATPPQQARRSVTQVITTFTSKTIVKVVSDSEAGIIQNIANQNWTTAANLMSTHKDLFDEIKSKVLVSIHEECMSYSNSNNKCMLWKNSPDNLKSFSFNNLISELEHRSPFLLSIFQTITNNNNDDAACAALCIALRGREPRLSAFSYHINTIIARGGIKKAVYNRLGKMAITTSYYHALLKQKEMKGAKRGATCGESPPQLDVPAETLQNPGVRKYIILLIQKNWGLKTQIWRAL